ncbi:YybH family protein [Sphingobium chungbukense]|uniref:YybH family protein n=1 Tax=Sphingobium chungbukense TaxID=56193 RepID=UPI00069A3E3E|nr:nuclear transport factor 2 family protein [Sphingobium chungbukense]
MTDMSTQDEAAIRQARSAFNEALFRKDLPAIDAILQDDYAVMPSFSARCFDKSGILGVYRNYFSDPGFVTFDRIADSIIIGTDGKRAAELGQWRGLWRTDSGERERTGIYHAAWLPSDLGWKLARESYVLLEG